MVSFFPDLYLSNLDRRIRFETTSVANRIMTFQKPAVFLGQVIGSFWSLLCINQRISFVTNGQYVLIHLFQALLYIYVSWIDIHAR